MPWTEFAVYLYFLTLSYVLGVGATALVRRMSLRWGFFDQPGERKVHHTPMPLMGGVAIFAVFMGIIGVHLLAFFLMGRLGDYWLQVYLLETLGPYWHYKLIGIVLGACIIFVLGLVDDLLSLTPWVKLIGQILAALALVSFGNRIEVFVLHNIYLSAAVTILWILIITNAMNFLDNMDGLCGGISVIAAFSFFLCLQGGDDQMTRVLLMIFAGAVGGFLYHNLNPARIFMGDAGSMFNGFFLATIAVIGTFHIEGLPSRVAVASPLLALSVPIFDIISVVYIRLRNGESIMKGDKRHFSHRLVDLGMTPGQAVSFIFLVGAVVGLGGALLPRLDVYGTAIILGQTIGIFMLIVVLMHVAKRGEQG